MNRCCHCDTTAVQQNKRDRVIMASYRTIEVPTLRDVTASRQQQEETAGQTPNRMRTVSYTIIEAKEECHRSAAIIMFYPLSGSSMTLSKMELDEYKCSVLAVDRPSCADTSPLSMDDERENEEDLKSIHRDEVVFLKRIRGHVDDVLAVLDKERINTIYLLGVCIGHPYAVELCRRCLPLNSQLASPEVIPKVGGMTLVAPFVSTACPTAWSVARFGASWWIPSSVLWGATETASIVATWVVPSVLSPKTIQSLLSTDEEREAWTTQQDFDDACQLLRELTKVTKNSRGIEARLGVSKIWQSEVCDRFATESGCGLIVDDDTNNIEKDIGVCPKSSPKVSSNKIPIRIHISNEDKLASISSIEWISRRCYGNASLTVEESIHSHEVMTFLGGPPRNPVLLHKVARDWDLLSATASLTSSLKVQ